MSVVLKAADRLVFASIKTRNRLAISSAKTVRRLDVTAGGGGGGGLTAVVGQTLGSVLTGGGGSSSYYSGFCFPVLPATITVTHLGRYKSSGDSGTHNLVLITTDYPYTLLSSVAVNMSASPDADGYVYAALSTPIVLSTGGGPRPYAVVSQEGDASDHFRDFDTIVTPCGDINIYDAFYIDPTLSFPGHSGSTGNSYGPVNFKYTL